MSHVVIKKQGRDIKVDDIVYVSGQDVNNFVKIEEKLKDTGTSKFHEETIHFNCKIISGEKKKIYFYRTKEYQFIIKVPNFNKIKYI